MSDNDPVLSRVSPLTIRAAWWAVRAYRSAKRDLRSNGLYAKVSPPPPLPWAARRGVLSVLHRVDPTCLERALVLQAWLSAHGRPHDVVVGVRKVDTELKAHAWIDYGGVRPDSLTYAEIHRISP